jgi:hypothetical protein
MPQPWFDPNLFSWIPGTVFGVAAGGWGSLAGVLAPLGKSPRIVLGAGRVLTGAALVMLVAGAIALATGQPYGVWYGLGLPGLLGTFLLPGTLPMVRRAYRQAEERRMRAHDLG